MGPWIKKYFWIVIIALAIMIAIPVAQWMQNRVETDSIQTASGKLDIHHWVTDSGMKVAFVQLPQLPFVDIQVVYAAGSAFDGEKFGLSQFTQQMMSEPSELHKAFESNGAQFGISGARDSLTIGLRTLVDSKYMSTPINTFKDVLALKVLNDDAFSREQTRLISTIQSSLQNPSYVISRTFWDKAYGSHPYAHPMLGTQETVANITLNDIKLFRDSYLVQENAVIAIAGDLSLKDAKRLVDEFEAVMPHGKKAAAIPPVALMPASNDQVKFPSSQTHIMMGLPSIDKHSADYFTLTLGNQILGGVPLVNELFQTVREKEGLAYNISSMIMPMQQPGPFIIYGQTRGSEAAKSNKLIMQTVERFLKDGPTATQLQSAKDYTNGQFVLGLSSNAAIASYIAQLAFYDLPWDYADTFMDNINAVTKEQIMASFSQYIKPQDFTHVMLGEG